MKQFWSRLRPGSYVLYVDDDARAELCKAKHYWTVLIDGRYFTQERLLASAKRAAEQFLQTHRSATP